MDLIALDLALLLRLDQPDFRSMFKRLMEQAYAKPVHPARIAYLEGFARQHGHADLIQKP